MFMVQLNVLKCGRCYMGIQILFAMLLPSVGAVLARLVWGWAHEGLSRDSLV